MIRTGKCHIQDLQLLRIFRFQQVQHILKETGLHRHDIFKAVNITHLKIHAGILVQMPFGVVLLGPEHRPGLKYPVEYSYHHLLVKLRALGQHRRMMEIFKAEQVRSSLRALGADLRRVDLGKALRIKKFPEPSHDSLLDAEFCPLPDVS